MVASVRKSVNPVMLSGAVGDSLYRLTVPLVLAIVVSMSFNVVDTYFIAQLGVQPLAAISFTFPVVMMYISVSIGITSGTTSILSRALGRGEEERARRIASDASTFVWIMSIVLAFLGWYFNDWVFLLLGAQGEVLEYIHDYMNIWYFGVPAMLVPSVCMATLRARGHSKLQSFIMMSAFFTNVILDPLLIFGYGIFPEMGMQGAALATVISRWLNLLLVYYILIYRVPVFGRLWEGWNNFRASLKAILHVGLPATATNMIVPLSGNIILAMVAAYGAAAVAGFGVALRIEMLALTVFYALSGVMGPFFGQNSGAQTYGRLHEAMRILVKFALAWGGACALVLWLAGDFLAGLFTESASAIEVADAYFLLVPISYAGYGIVMSVNAAFNGLAKPLPGLLVSTCRVIIVLLPLVYLLKYYWGLNGIFMAIAISNIGLGVAGLWLLYRHIQRQQQADMAATVS